jgi:hypothetical protein
MVRERIDRQQPLPVGAIPLLSLVQQLQALCCLAYSILSQGLLLSSPTIVPQHWRRDYVGPHSTHRVVRHCSLQLPTPLTSIKQRNSSTRSPKPRPPHILLSLLHLRLESLRFLPLQFRDLEFQGTDIGVGVLLLLCLDIYSDAGVEFGVLNLEFLLPLAFGSLRGPFCCAVGFFFLQAEDFLFEGFDVVFGALAVRSGGWLGWTKTEGQMGK